MENKNEGYVFGLDIGTRSIVGTVGYRIGVDRFVVVAQEVIEHTTRAVIDGQIHDISTVSKTITEIKNRLEKTLHQDLYEVSIAAAGRVLKTRKVMAEYEFPDETRVTAEHIRTLDMVGVEKAYAEIRRDEEDVRRNFYCVGFSTVKYYLNGYPMELIEHHKANTIGVELIATFLPEEVVDGLYAAVEDAGLHVATLTLEPIAAINIAIPEKFRLLNIALVDVGAGTSDISVVKDGSIIAFGMIPLAGDEVTEEIARKYLIDFETAERIKRQCDKKKSIGFENIFGEHIRVTKDEILEVSERAVDEITKQVAARILELNGGKVSAVFVVGGGGKHEGFTEKLAQYLDMPGNRVANRGAEVLTHVDFIPDNIQKDSTLVTPIGICMNYYEKRSNFIHVFVNDQRVKLYDNGKATVLDACIGAGYQQTNLFPLRGSSLTYYVNGNERVKKGRAGEVAEVKRNGREVSLNELVKENDEIFIKPSTKGTDARVQLGDVPECRGELALNVFGQKIVCPKIIEVNGALCGDRSQNIKNMDRVEVFDYYTVEKLLQYIGMEEEKGILLNGMRAGLDARVGDGDIVEKNPAPPKVNEPEPELKPESEPASAVTVEQKKVDSALRPNRELGIKLLGGRNRNFPGAEPEPEKKEPEEDDEKSDIQKQIEKDPLLQPMKPLPAWMEGIPFDTPKLGADGQIIPGILGRGGNGNSGSGNSGSGMDMASGHRPLMPVRVTVNGKPVTMPAKEKPIFVDVFDVYPFDMSKAGGTRLITRINGEDKEFTEPVWDGDAIELYWEK